MGRKSLGWITGGVLRNFTAAVDSLSFLSVNRTIICIDDLERKGSNLSIKDVLGLVSLFKEQKKCKIAILVNDNDEGLSDYTKYREKVIDAEVKFAPTAAECASIAFDSEGYIYEVLIESAKKLDIRNIRLLKKIERLIKMAAPYLGKIRTRDHTSGGPFVDSLFLVLLFRR